MKALIDTNVVLASVSVTNTFFLLRKNKFSPGKTYEIIDGLIKHFTIAPVTEATIASALALRWKDFEDAVQFIAAKENYVDFIITRNKKDFQTSDIPCMTPTEFIEYLKEKEEAEKKENE